MTRLYNRPEDFADEMIDGFVAANGRWVRRVTGGVVRSASPVEGTVAVVIGGGSGHYPAFGGLVGHGLAHGAALGNLFASPSSQQIQAVARAASSGGGILLAYGNYAGDVLNFENAQTRLRTEGYDVETVTVTDDISSASVAEKQKRRGIAGDLAVFKCAGAASEAGYSLEETAAVACKANERTRSFGVAFSGCTLPGADAPLFEVPAGRMAVGMGIHGEPGIAEQEVPSADELATLLVDALLAELPDDVDTADGSRVVAIVNGLGSVKYEELFVVYSSISRLLARRGLIVVEPEVGELVTSFDMAGVSLTLFWLDDELEALWTAPASSPAFKKGAVEPATAEVDEAAHPVRVATIPPASDASREAAEVVLATLESIKRTVDGHADELGRIDAVAGDGDHGIGMQRGAGAAVEAARAAVNAGAGSGTVLTRAGDAWSDRAGGTSGALWGAALAAVGAAVTDQAAPNRRSIVTGVDDARDAILGFGAQVGDKTMVDALVPFAATLAAAVDAGHVFSEAWGSAATAASSAAEGTARLLPRMGRARPHAERSLGTPDAGATSFALIVTGIGEILTARRA